MAVQITSRGTEKRNATTSGNQRRRRVGGGENHKQEKSVWKGCTAKEDTWESRENLRNAMELVEEFEKEYCREEEEEVR